MALRPSPPRPAPIARHSWRRIGVLGVIAAVSAACPASPPPASDAAVAAGQGAPAPAHAIAQRVYDGGVQGGWKESGSAVRELTPGQPARVRFGPSGDWVFAAPSPQGPFGGLSFLLQEPAGEGELVELQLASSGGQTFPAVKLKPNHRIDLPTGWTQVFVPMTDLDPTGAPFDRIVVRSFRPFDSWVLFDKIALTRSDGSAPAAGTPAQAPPASAPAAVQSSAIRVRVRCDAAPTRISPLIYGIAFYDKGSPSVDATARRWGGNPTTRYNWKAHVDNVGSDWCFENQPGDPYTKFLTESAEAGARAALTVPMIGWVAKDPSSSSFPVSVFGPQTQTDPPRDAGNGIAVGGKEIAPGPPTRTSVPAPPEFMKDWVSAIRARDAKTGGRSVYEYILDNEPALWSHTHRDVHPDPVTYDELLDRTIKYATAIRQADPDAVIAGPAEWGWTAYFYSAKDVSGAFGVHVDRLAHGDVPLVEWYLRKLREYEQKNNVRLLDLFDLHFYPQEANVYGGGAGGSDRQTQLLRLRSTRSLWDPAYVDESWIHDAIRLLPRMKEWVAANYPGRGISIGEWNFGGEKDVTGALATAEALGRFAQYDVTSAFYWTVPPSGSPSRYGFLAYRNFDGHGGHFLDWYVPSVVSDDSAAGEPTTVFASRDAAGTHLVIVAINMSPDAPRVADLDLSGCGVPAAESAFVYQNGSPGFVVAKPADADAGAKPPSRWTLPPWSINVFDVRLR